MFVKGHLPSIVLLASLVFIPPEGLAAEPTGGPDAGEALPPLETIEDEATRDTCRYNMGVD